MDTEQKIQIFNTVMEAVPTLIVALVSLLSAYMVTRISKQSDREKFILEARRELYVTVYTELDKVLFDDELIMKTEFYNILAQVKPKLYILGSRKVRKSFKKFARYVLDYRKQYDQAISDYDNENNPEYKNLKYIPEIDDFIPTESHYDISIYRQDLRNYKRACLPQSCDYFDKVHDILDSMQYDIVPWENNWISRTGDWFEGKFSKKFLK